MDQRFTIGQLASAVGVPTTTVRYYERRGLLAPATRTGSGNYRTYGNDEVERLRFVRAAQASGFALEDVARLLAFRDGRTPPCREVQDLIESRLNDVAERLCGLARVERVLKASLKLCRQNERGGRCEVIDTLTVAAVGSKPCRRG
ncbi:MAG: MerR family transcriptional regulator [Gemmatimonadaceae bacterium]|nr:MerR family transcriptional regulator [Gemmatimonadaceae bacterium]